METLEEWRARKRWEVAWLAGRLEQPVAVPERLEAGAVLPWKLRLRARRRAEWTLRHPLLTETNPKTAPNRRADPYTLRYRYQRFDLDVAGPCPYPGLVDDLPLMRSDRWVSSGMGAISSLLVALRHAAPRVRLVLAGDTYFETARALSLLAPTVEVVAAASAESLRDALPPADGATVGVWGDTISKGDPTPALEALEPGEADLVVLDTTCHALDDPRLRAVVARTVDTGAVVALLRSHVKLDYLGVEYGRLGSAVLTVCPVAAAPRLPLFRHLARGLRLAARTLGATAVPDHLLPDLDDPAFHALNRVRIDQLRRANDRAARQIAAGTDLEVGRFHHDLFFVVDLGELGASDPGAVERALVALVERARAAGLEVRRANSFGLDLVAIADFIDEDRRAEGVRVGMPDWPPPLVDAFVTVFLGWLR